MWIFKTGSIYTQHEVKTQDQEKRDKSGAKAKKVSYNPVSYNLFFFVQYDLTFPL